MTDPTEVETVRDVLEPRVTSLLSIQVVDLATGVLEPVRAAYARSIGKAFAELDPAQQAEADRWGAGLASMVRFHRGGGPAQLEIVRAADGTVQANMVAGKDPRSSSASSTLILAGAPAAAAAAPAPQRQPKPPSVPHGAKPTRPISRPLPPAVRTAPPARMPTTTRGR